MVLISVVASLDSFNKHGDGSAFANIFRASALRHVAKDVYRVAVLTLLPHNLVEPGAVLCRLCSSGPETATTARQGVSPAKRSRLPLCQGPARTQVPVYVTGKDPACTSPR